MVKCLSCLWCEEEGQNEGTVINHLQTNDYHLGHICGWCLEYFTNSADTMCCYSQLCKPALACVDNDDQDEESDH